MTKEDRTNIALYHRTHRWLYSNYGAANRCEHCNISDAKRYEWAKKEGCSYDYNRDNFIMLCPSCHRKYDETPESRLNRRESHLGQEAINRRSISQYDKDGRLIGKYLSVIAASQETGIIRTGIMNTLSGLSKMAGGFIWRYN